jgi:hypothetical protein
VHPQGLYSTEGLSFCVEQEYEISNADTALTMIQLEACCINASMQWHHLAGTDALVHSRTQVFKASFANVIYLLSPAFDLPRTSMSSTKTSPLRQLADLISSKVSEIEAIFEKQGLDYPGLDNPFVPGSPSELAALAPDVAQCTALVVAACGQLSTTLNGPGATLFNTSAGVSRFS